LRAQEYCTDRGMELISVETRKELSDVWNAVPSKGARKFLCIKHFYSILKSNRLSYFLKFYFDEFLKYDLISNRVFQNLIKKVKSD